MVGEENDDGIVVEAVLVDGGEDAADLRVDGGKRAEVALHGFGALKVGNVRHVLAYGPLIVFAAGCVEGFNLGGSGVAVVGGLAVGLEFLAGDEAALEAEAATGVGRTEGHDRAEGLGGVAFFDVFDGVVGEKLRLPAVMTNAHLGVTDVKGLFEGLVRLLYEPVVETVADLGWGVLVIAALHLTEAHVPFAHVGSLVPGGFAEVAQREAVGHKRGFIAEHAVVQRILSAEQAGAVGRAHRHGGSMPACRPVFAAAKRSRFGVETLS